MPESPRRRFMWHARRSDDSEAIARIYNQGIEDRVATFETRLRSAEDIRAWFDGVHPIVVVEESGQVIAFGATSLYRPRECYAGIAEASLYVAREALGRQRSDCAHLQPGHRGSRRHFRNPLAERRGHTRVVRRCPSHCRRRGERAGDRVRSHVLVPAEGVLCRNRRGVALCGTRGARTTAKRLRASTTRASRIASPLSKPACGAPRTYARGSTVSIPLSSSRRAGR